VTQVNITVSTILASFFAGGPTYLFYGMRLIQFPLGIFGVALATAILPTLSAQAARGALDELRTTLGFGLRMILFIILPAMLGLILLRQPIVHLFFEHGTFTAHDTAETARAVLCYSIGLWAFGGVRIIVSAFYSLQDTRTPAISAAIAVAANLVFSFLLMSSLGAAGLALATALAAMVNGGILVAVLHRRLGGVEWGSAADDFFYSWSELTLAPFDELRIGLVTQRTRVYETDRNVQRGLLAGFSWFNNASFMGASPKPLPFGPVYGLQLSMSYLTIAVPSYAARVAMSVRFFQRQAVPAAAALAAGALDI
jgi:murein biosynthesis integral membrane protein MurJ